MSLFATVRIVALMSGARGDLAPIGGAAFSKATIGTDALPLSALPPPYPTILRRIVDDVSAERHRESLGEERFTLLEMVCHLADSEDLFLDRMRAAIERDVPEFERVDVSERAREKRFAERNIHEELQVFANRRRDTIDFLEGLSEAQLARTFKQAFGTMSIEAFVALLAGTTLPPGAGERVPERVKES